ncbi:MAG TPA: NAD(P)-binding domain-containing protein [Solirubrobacterales bacterium]|nr:NAD(P)-binding domain-containing protein [Solirubrobacterales bacterium]
MTERRHCIIGAGYAGNGVAKAFRDAGIPYDQLERNEYVGGNWADGVYDSTQIISSRDSTQYGDFPMPREYPDFPTREQVLAYLNEYMDHFGLRERIEFGTEVVRCEPLDRNGISGWRVELASGEERDYAGVVVANGHHWNKRYPDYPGEFDGHEIHSKDYKRPEDLDGDRVLVVGAGNSGCDIAVEAAKELGSADISMRRGYWFLPKTIFGIPTAELDRPWFPVWAQRLFMRAMLRIVYGRYERYGLRRPDHRLFDKHPTVNSQLLYALRHGRVHARPDIARLDGRTVHFVDGTSVDYGTIVWATGFHVSFPFLERDLFEWRNGAPVRVAGMLPPGMANLYAYGVMQPRGGAGPLITASARLLAEMVRAQERLDHPLADDLARLQAPSARMLVGVSETMRRIAVGRRALRGVLVANRLAGHTVQPAA